MKKWLVTDLEISVNEMPDIHLYNVRYTDYNV